MFKNTQIWVYIIIRTYNKTFLGGPVSTLRTVLICLVLSLFSITSLYAEPDFSDTVDAEINSTSGLGSVEGNLKLWLDANNIDGLDNTTLTNDQGVSSWMDLSENGNSIAPSGTSPKFKQNGNNGFSDPVVYFNEQYMITNTGSFGIQTKATIYMVFELLTSGGTPWNTSVFGLGETAFNISTLYLSPPVLKICAPVNPPLYLPPNIIPVS